MKLTKINIIAFMTGMIILVYSNISSQTIEPLQDRQTERLINTSLRLSDGRRTFLSLKKDIVNYPIFDIHAGAGLVNGLRIGARVKIKHFSFEVAYGVIGSTGGFSEIMSAGINYYPIRNCWYIISLICSNSRKSFSISPNIGAITIDTINIVGFIRIGFILILKKNMVNSLSQNNLTIFPNVDAGFGWRFSF